MPATAEDEPVIVKRAWPPAATVCVEGETVMPTGTEAETTVKSAEAVNAPSACTEVDTVGLKPLLMSTVVDVEAGERLKPAGPMVMNGRLRELVAEPVAELALMNAAVVPVLAAPTAATSVNTAFAEPPAGTLTTCEVPGVTATAEPNGLEKKTVTEPAKLLMDVTVTVTVVCVVPSGGRMRGVLCVFCGFTLKLKAPRTFSVKVVVALTPLDTPLMRIGYEPGEASAGSTVTV